MYSGSKTAQGGCVVHIQVAAWRVNTVTDSFKCSHIRPRIYTRRKSRLCTSWNAILAVNANVSRRNLRHCLSSYDGCQMLTFCHLLMIIAAWLHNYVPLVVCSSLDGWHCLHGTYHPYSNPYPFASSCLSLSIPLLPSLYVSIIERLLQLVKHWLFHFSVRICGYSWVQCFFVKQNICR